VGEARSQPLEVLVRPRLAVLAHLSQTPLPAADLLPLQEKEATEEGSLGLALLYRPRLRVGFQLEVVQRELPAPPQLVVPGRARRPNIFFKAIPFSARR